MIMALIITFANFIYCLQPMSPKKTDAEVSKNAVEAELAQLAGEIPGPSKQASGSNELTSLFSEFFKKQENQHKQLIKSIGDSSQASVNAVVTAINNAIPAPPQQHQSAPACPSRLQVSPQDLYSPEDEEGWEEVEGEVANSEDEDEDDIENWDFPPSGQQSHSQNAPPAQALPTGSNTASTSTSEVPVDSELFNTYGLPMNWNLAPELINWLRLVTNKEVPYSVLKSLNETFVPKEDLQPFFTAPDLPVAISRLLYTAPKSLSRGPKILNTALLRVQRELCIAYKPILEILNFFYSEAFDSLIEILPQLKEIFTRQKLLLSQNLAILISASLRVSKARKHALRPIVKYSSSGILQHQPTAQHVLGSSDLASLADKANKENKALSGVFRYTGRNRGRYRAQYQYQPYNLNYRGYQYTRRQQPQRNYPNQNSRRFPRGKSKKGLAASSNSK